MATTDPFDQFVHELLRTAGLDGLPDDARAEVAGKLRDEAQRRMGIIAIQYLDAAGLEEFQAMIASTSPPDAAAIQAFFTSRIPEFDVKVRAGLLQFADEFVTASKANSPSKANSQ